MCVHVSHINFCFVFVQQSRCASVGVEYELLLYGKVHHFKLDTAAEHQQMWCIVLQQCAALQLTMLLHSDDMFCFVIICTNASEAAPFVRLVIL